MTPTTNPGSRDETPFSLDTATGAPLATGAELAKANEAMAALDPSEEGVEPISQDEYNQRVAAISEAPEDEIAGETVGEESATAPASEETAHTPIPSEAPALDVPLSEDVEPLTEDEQAVLNGAEGDAAVDSSDPETPAQPEADAESAAHQPEAGGPSEA